MNVKEPASLIIRIVVEVVLVDVAPVVLVDVIPVRFVWIPAFPQDDMPIPAGTEQALHVNWQILCFCSIFEHQVRSELVGE